MNIRIKRMTRVLRRTGKGRIRSDVEGSYTGVPERAGEKPIQDADDL